VYPSFAHALSAPMLCLRPCFRHCQPLRRSTTARLNADQRPGGAFLGGSAATLDGAAAGFFLLVDFGFFASRLLRFCPLSNPVLLRSVNPPELVGAGGGHRRI